jgi:hypothetical protein
MAWRLLILGTLVTLAACADRPVFSGASTAQPAFGSPAAAESAVEGCASGADATLLHQNRPGGSDYDSRRCHSQGY